MVLMIIKGLCKRYERWNPVHPTSGAFLGMGIGIGCGVGWGPGFGPEVIGYVGAGCGIGFSVGITLAGVGIGLPTNIILRAPYSALVALRGCMFECMQSNHLLTMKNSSKDCWNSCAPQSIFGLQKAAARKGMVQLDVVKLRNTIASNTESALEGVRTFGSRFFGPRKGDDLHLKASSADTTLKQQIWCAHPSSTADVRWAIVITDIDQHIYAFSAVGRKKK